MVERQSSEAIGTRDETYDVISIVYHALQGAENCELYEEDAERDELKQFFRRAAEHQKQLADEGKRLLMQCLQDEGGSGRSAFGFSQGLPGSVSEQSETVSTEGSGGTGGGRF